MINYLGKDVININDKERIVIDANEKNNIFWKEVYFETECGKSFIGSYFTHRDILDYNDLYIAIIAVEYDNNNPIFRIKKIFDIINREFIMGSQEELLEFYQNEFLTERIVRSL